ncbi:DUF2868 domain-containing protein [Pelovirga terrestris]|uniref:DUF2868 domain-containing protein n=1 Tax=Pelovirga terrestris TaxID=2771352 RepID=A0A8J6QNV0_9BACT|nr:DUF2868 domain-containing protein [Pelovirga terrestris]MBD1399866.1 DUF2868 domain-containing protein [Pelovirga terrestris]
MKPLFSLPDILDLEFLFKRDEPRLEQGDDTELRRRDRAIYLATGLDVSADPATRELAGHWLCARRQEYQRQQLPLPGQIWQETTTFSAFLFFLLSLLAGVGMAASFLRYDGTTPVNVSGFFAIFILVQLLLVMLNLGLFAYRLVPRVKVPKSVLYALLSRALAKLFTSVFKRSQKHLPATRRLDLQAVVGSLQQLRHLYGNLLLWPAFILLQLAGIGFNLGVLLTLLAKISFTDIAFGWQSTLPLTDAFLAELVRWIALPWSWLLPPEWAYPEIEQIIGSKIVLIEGNWRLTSMGLASWWPFLLCGVLIYGLLPRLLLLSWGRYQLRAGLKHLPCDNASFRQLRRRMLTPSVQTAASHSIAPFSPSPSPATATPAQSALKQHTNRRGWLLLIPDELWEQCPTEKITPYLHQIAPDEPLVSLRYGALDQSGQAFLEQLIAIMNNDKLAGIMLLQEAWQPPIRELTTLLRQLRQLTTPTTPLALALTGRAQRGEMITAVPSADLQLWQKTVKTLADPYLEVFTLMTEQ